MILRALRVPGNIFPCPGQIATLNILNSVTDGQTNYPVKNKKSDYRGHDL